MAIDNGAPIEDLLVSIMVPIIIAAGSNMIKFWDISAGHLILSIPCLASKDNNIYRPQF